MMRSFLSDIVLRAMDDREYELAGKQLPDGLPYIRSDNQIAPTIAIGRLTQSISQWPNVPLAEDHTWFICRIEQLESPQRITHLDGKAIRQTSRQRQYRQYS